MIQFLKDKYVKSLKNSGIDLPSSDQLKELLKYATDDILIKYLEKADKELIPKGRFDIANSMALDIFNLRRENTKISYMAMDIVKKCSQ